MSLERVSYFFVARMESDKLTDKYGAMCSHIALTFRDIDSNTTHTLES